MRTATTHLVSPTVPELVTPQAGCGPRLLPTALVCYECSFMAEVETLETSSVSLRAVAPSGVLQVSAFSPLSIRQLRI